jgi:hypothetical protein
MHSLFRRAFVAIGFLALASALGCGGGKYDSPEACFRTMQVAAHNEDWPAVCDCLTADSQEELAGMLVMAGTMMKMQSDSAPVVEALEKHGVTDEALQEQGASIFAMSNPGALRGLAKLVKDKAAFIADMIVAMQKLRSATQFNSQFENQIAGELSDVKVTGDEATAVVVGAEGKTKTPVEFRKTPEGWKRHVNLGAMGLGAAPAA